MAVSSVSSSSIAMTGLFSNLDTDSIINAIMATDKNKLTTLQNRKSDYEAQQTLFRTVNTKLSALKSAAFDLSLSSSLSATKAASSNATVVSTTSTSGAAVGSYQISVDHLAKAETIKSDNLTMDAAASADLLAFNGKTVTINGKSVTFDFSDLTEAATADKPVTNKQILDSMKKAINSVSGINVNASVTQTTDTQASLVLASSKTGTSNAITFGSDPDSQNLKALLGNTVQSADDALFYVNGVEITSSSNTVTSAIENVTLTLSDKGNATIDITSDTDAIAANVQKFVDAYNEVIDAINAAKDYKDSNDRSVLQTDSMLTSLQSQLSNWINASAGQPNGGAAGSSPLSLKYLYQVGLEIDKDATTADAMTGKLSFDKDKFVSALNSDPEGVYQLFAYNGNGTSSDGVFRAINSSLTSWTSYTNGTVKSKIDGYDSEISFISDEMEQLQERLDLREQSLKEKYSNMEVSLSSLQNTQSWLTSQFNALMG